MPFQQTSAQCSRGWVAQLSRLSKWALAQSASDFRPIPWVDIEEAASAIDEAEGALRAGDSAMAWGFANVVISMPGGRYSRSRSRLDSGVPYEVAHPSYSRASNASPR